MSDAPPKGRLKTWSFDAYVVGIATAGNGKRFAVGLGDGTARLIDADHPEPLPIKIHDGACLEIVSDIDSDGFLSGGDDGKCMRIDGAGAVSLVAHLKGKWIDHVAAHAGSGFRVFSAGKDAYVLDRKAVEPRRLAHPTSVGGLAINPKGRRLAVAHYNGVSLWWLASGDSKPLVLEWGGSHLQVVWSPDGDYVVTAMQENALHGWRLSDGQHMRMQGYGAKVRSLCFTRKGHMLPTGGADTVICWPFTGTGPMGKPPLEFGGGVAGASAGTAVTAVAANPKRDVIAAGFANGAVILGQPGAARSVTIAGAGGAALTALAWNGAGDRLLFGDEGGGVSLADFRS